MFIGELILFSVSRKSTKKFNTKLHLHLFFNLYSCLRRIEISRIGFNLAIISDPANLHSLPLLAAYSELGKLFHQHSSERAKSVRCRGVVCVKSLSWKLDP